SGSENSERSLRTMALTHEEKELQQAAELAGAPLFALDCGSPRHKLPEDELSPDLAYQIIHDELMLDGNARLNVATFVTTWMEPQAQQLMTQWCHKKMIGEDEHPEYRVRAQQEESEGRVPADGPERGALREDAQPALARAGGRRGDRLLHD